MFNTRNKSGISAHPCIILYLFGVGTNINKVLCIMYGVIVGESSMNKYNIFADPLGFEIKNRRQGPTTAGYRQKPAAISNPGSATLVFTYFVETSCSVSNEMIMKLNFVPRFPILNTVHMRSMFSRDIFRLLKFD